MTAHPLYTLAVKADDRYSALIAQVSQGRRNRWTITAEDLRLHPEIRLAYEAKVDADEVWLAFLQADALSRQARRYGGTL